MHITALTEGERAFFVFIRNSRTALLSVVGEKTKFGHNCANQFAKEVPKKGPFLYLMQFSHTQQGAIIGV